MIDRDVVDCTEEIGNEDVGSVTGKDRIALDQDAVLTPVDLHAVVMGITPRALQIMDIVPLHDACAILQGDTVFHLGYVVAEKVSAPKDRRVACSGVAGTNDIAVLDSDVLRPLRIDTPVTIEGNDTVLDYDVVACDAQRSIDDLVLDHDPVARDRHRAGVGCQRARGTGVGRIREAHRNLSCHAWSPFIPRTRRHRMGLEFITAS